MLHGAALTLQSQLERERALVAVQSGESVVPASALAAARARIAQLQRMLGKKALVQICNWARIAGVAPHA